MMIVQNIDDILHTPKLGALLVLLELSWFGLVSPQAHHLTPEPPSTPSPSPETAKTIWSYSSILLIVLIPVTTCVLAVCCYCFRRLRSGDEEDSEVFDDNTKSVPPVDLEEAAGSDPVLTRYQANRGGHRLTSVPPIIILPNEGRTADNKPVPKRPAPLAPSQKIWPPPAARPVPPPKPTLQAPAAHPGLNLPTERGAGISRPNRPPPTPPSYEQAISQPNSPTTPYFVQYIPTCTTVDIHMDQAKHTRGYR